MPKSPLAYKMENPKRMTFVMPQAELDEFQSIVAKRRETASRVLRAMVNAYVKKYSSLPGS